jgi:hypothetical protein
MNFGKTYTNAEVTVLAYFMMLSVRQPKMLEPLPVLAHLELFMNQLLLQLLRQEMLKLKEMCQCLI